jgi:hypothetical protein
MRTTAVLLSLVLAAACLLTACKTQQPRLGIAYLSMYDATTGAPISHSFAWEPNEPLGSADTDSYPRDVTHLEAGNIHILSYIGIKPLSVTVSAAGYQNKTVVIPLADYDVRESSEPNLEKRIDLEPAIGQQGHLPRLRFSSETIRAEPDGPANGSQPFRSQTNQPSGAAGSRR